MELNITPLYEKEIRNRIFGGTALDLKNIPKKGHSDIHKMLTFSLGISERDIKQDNSN